MAEVELVVPKAPLIQTRVLRQKVSVDVTLRNGKLVSLISRVSFLYDRSHKIQRNKDYFFRNTTNDLENWWDSRSILPHFPPLIFLIQFPRCLAVASPSHRRRRFLKSEVKWRRLRMSLRSTTESQDYGTNMIWPMSRCVSEEQGM